MTVINKDSIPKAGWKGNIPGWVLFTMLFTALMATAAAWVLPEYFEGNPSAIATAECAGVGALVLAILACRLGTKANRRVNIVVAVLASFALITNPFSDRDWGASFNRAARTARVIQKLTQRDQEYAKHHHGSFAASLDQLGINASSDGYTLVYNPVWPQAGWRSFYADESGVIRFQDGLRAEKNSAPI